MFLLPSGFVIYLVGALSSLWRCGQSRLWPFCGRQRRPTAYEVPPPWDRTLHGAETWALRVAMGLALPGVGFRTDGKSVLDAFHSGQEAATAPTRPLARVWSLISAAIDDYADSSQVELVWLPAHVQR